MFVAGMHRSGTTLLGDILGAHPDVARLVGTGRLEEEGQHVQHMLPRGLDLGGTTRWALNSDAHMTEDDVVDADVLREHLESSWEPYWSKPADVVVEKSPPTVGRMRLMQHLWPEARFIVMTRHPLVQALSVQKWNRTYPISLSTLGAGFAGTLENWFAGADMLAEDAPHVRHLLVLRYEHLIDDPAGQLARVADFVGLEGGLDATMVEPARNSVYEAFVEGQLARSMRAYPDLFARRKSATTGVKGAIRRGSWAVTSRAWAATGRLPRLCRRYEERSLEHGYDITSLRTARPFEAARI